MSRNKKKKSLSRRLRKLRGLGRVKRVENFVVSSPETKEIAKEKSPVTETKVKVIKKKPLKLGVTIPDSEIVLFDKDKSKEIFHHVRTVMTVSVVCLMILGVLYYFERQNDWVNSINIEVNDLMANWDWKL